MTELLRPTYVNWLLAHQISVWRPETDIIDITVTDIVITDIVITEHYT